MANHINSNFNVLHDDLFCEYCGKQCKSINSLKQHSIRCSKNPNRTHKGGMPKGHVGWNKGLTKDTDERVKINTEHVSESVRGENNPFYGKHHTNESREKIRLGTVKYLNTIEDGIKVRYNKNACTYIDNLNKKFNWNLQHAENGGEYCINGYFLDGYDKDRNIAFEYDEKRHYIDVYNNVLRPSDVERMNNIKNELKCKFYRYNEVLDLFYEA